MPLWLHIFNPLLMLLSIIIVLILNYLLMLFSSIGICTNNNFKFALSKLMNAFICAVITIAVGYAFMGGTFILSDASLQNNLLKCDYSNMNTLRIPIVSLFISSVIGYALSKLILFKKSNYDNITRTALCCSFVIINLPYVLIIPIVK